MGTDPYRFERPARRPGAYALIGAGLAILVVLAFGIDAHPAIVAVAALAVAPAILDVIRGSTATLTLTEREIGWTSGARTARVPLDAIEEVRLATTLDFSQKAVLRLRDGRKVRIPPECLPGGQALDAELERRGVPHSRSLFAL